MNKIKAIPDVAVLSEMEKWVMDGNPLVFCQEEPRYEGEIIEAWGKPWRILYSVTREFYTRNTPSRDLGRGYDYFYVVELAD